MLAINLYHVAIPAIDRSPSELNRRPGAFKLRRILKCQGGWAAGSTAVEEDPTKRNAMIHEAAGILQKDFGYIPLHQQTLAWAAKSNIELVQMADNYFFLRFVRIK